MIAKAFEVRDAGTFIPVIGILMKPRFVPELGMVALSDVEARNAERYLLRAAGFNFDHPNVLLCRMEASGTDNNATYDWSYWPLNPRTMRVAHQYIADHWEALETGAVIDVEFILGLKPKAKTSQRLEEEEQQ